MMRRLETVAVLGASAFVIVMLTVAALSTTLAGAEWLGATF